MFGGKASCGPTPSRMTPLDYRFSPDCRMSINRFFEFFAVVNRRLKLRSARRKSIIENRGIFLRKIGVPKGTVTPKEYFEKWNGSMGCFALGKGHGGARVSIRSGVAGGCDADSRHKKSPMDFSTELLALNLD